MKKMLALFALCSLFTAKAQVYYYYGHSSTYYSTRQYTSNVNQNLSVDNAVNQTFGLINGVLADKKQKEAAAAKLEQQKKKVADIRSYYESLGNYPEKVADGWHEIVLLGGETFIADAKVQVKNNKITDLVWDNWIPEELAFSGPVIKAKSGLKIKGGIGPFEGLLDVYFINFIADNTQTAPAPLKAGKITVWTNNKDYKKYCVKFQDEVVGFFKTMHKFDAAPQCGDINEITIVYKPGVYRLQMGSKKQFNRLTGEYELAAIHDTKIEIKEDDCVILQMNDPKKMNK